MAMVNIDTYQEADRALESYWRSVILFGRNVASYKFALAKSLLELATQGKDSVTLEELSVPFSRHLCEHLAHSPRQGTSAKSDFLATCADFNAGIATYDQLISKTTKKGFTNVIDAFHVVNRGEIDVRFYQKDYTGGSKRIILTDQVFQLAESEFAANYEREIESRWNLVETAWELGVSTSLLQVAYDSNADLITAKNKLRRKNVTSARGALNGYQKGKCFYCYSGINASDGIRTQASQEIDPAQEPKIIWDTTPESYHYEVMSFDFSDVYPGEPEVEAAVTETGPAPAGSQPAAGTQLGAEPQSQPEPRLLLPNDPAPATNASPLCDVDHFFPHMLQPFMPKINLDGVWNLVLACPDCNRGEGGKFALVPDLKYLARLHRRNEYLINSHHPLRETIIAQTGANEQARRQFLYHVDQEAISLLQHRWTTEQRAAATF